MIDPELEASMDEVLKVVVFGRAARNTANIKSRQPIANMYIKAAKTLDDYFVDILRDELNVKNVEFKEDLSAFTAYSFKPQLRTVGPKYGKHLKCNQGVPCKCRWQQSDERAQGRRCDQVHSR